MRRGLARSSAALRLAVAGLGLALAAGLAAGLAGCGPQLVERASGERPGPVLVEDVRIWDGESEALSSPSAVWIEGGRIEAILPAGEALPARLREREDLRVVGGAGRVLAPALVDFHAHFGMSSGRPPWDASLLSQYSVGYELEAYLYAGVTTVVAASPVLPSSLGAALFGPPEGPPRVFGTERLVTAEGGHPAPMLDSLLPWPLAALAKGSLLLPLDPASPELDRVRALLERDPHHLKLIVDGAIPPGSPKLSPDAIRSVVRLGERANVPVYVHVAHPEDLRPAVRAGAEVLMHTPYQAPIERETLALLAEEEIPVVSTVQVWEWVLRGLSPRPRFSSLERTLMSAGTLESLRSDWSEELGYFEAHGFPAGYVRETIPRLHRNLEENLVALHEAGVPIVAGTDYGLPGLTPGASLVRELHRLSALGLRNVEVLRSATSLPGRLLREGGPRLGVVEEGARAELLLLPSSPLDDLDALRHVELVLSAGRIYERARPLREGAGEP